MGVRLSNLSLQDISSNFGVHACRSGIGFVITDANLGKSFEGETLSIAVARWERAKPKRSKRKARPLRSA